jgi:hypothetical protein
MTEKAKADPSVCIISDIDELHVDTVTLYEQLLNRHIRMMGHPACTSQEVRAAGGTQVAYRKYYPELTDEQWDHFMERVRMSNMVNRNGDLYHPEQIRIANEIFASANFLGYMTARPLTERVIKTTEKDLFERLGLPCAQVMLRPEDVKPEQSGIWKVKQMHAIRTAAGVQHLILVDDSISTAKQVSRYNAEIGENGIIQVLFKGPLTTPALQAGTFVPDQSLGIYAADWDEMPVVFDRIREQW